MTRKAKLLIFKVTRLNAFGKHLIFKAFEYICTVETKLCNNDRYHGR